MKQNNIVYNAITLVFVMLFSQFIKSQTSTWDMCVNMVCVIDTITLKNPYVISRMEINKFEPSLNQDSIQMHYLVDGVNYLKICTMVNNIDIYPHYGYYTLRGRGYMRIGLSQKYLPFHPRKRFEYANFDFTNSVKVVDQLSGYSVRKFYEKEMEFYVLLVCDSLYMYLMDYHIKTNGNYYLVLIPKYPLQYPD